MHLRRTGAGGSAMNAGDYFFGALVLLIVGALGVFVVVGVTNDRALQKSCDAVACPAPADIPIVHNERCICGHDVRVER